MTITITWVFVKVVYLAVFVLSLVVFFLGELPGNPGSSAATGLRWVLWPLCLLLTLFFLGRGLWL